MDGTIWRQWVMPSHHHRPKLAANRPVYRVCIQVNLAIQMPCYRHCPAVSRNHFRMDPKCQHCPDPIKMLAFRCHTDLHRASHHRMCQTFDVMIVSMLDRELVGHLAVEIRRIHYSRRTVETFTIRFNHWRYADLFDGTMGKCETWFYPGTKKENIQLDNASH